MRYQGSEARRLETAERRRSQQRTIERISSFEVLEGAGLDAKIRQGVSPLFMRRVRMVLIAAAIFIVLGLARVALYSATLGSLMANENLRSEIETAQATNIDLEMNMTTLSNASRIDRIATQNYGMVAPTSTETITLEDQSAASVTSPTGEAAASSQQ